MTRTQPREPFAAQLSPLVTSTHVQLPSWVRTYCVGVSPDGQHSRPTRSVLASMLAVLCCTVPAADVVK
jgi:hypothetical protein